MAAHAPARVTRERRAELLHGIYAILNEDPRVLEIAEAALGNGIRIVQYRAKRGIVGRRLAALRAMTRERDALLLLNDDWRAVETFDCDGVHLGPADAGFASLAAVRDAMPERLIGLSCGTIAEARAVDARNVDYLGVGSVYATASKLDAGEPIGIDGLLRVASATTLPVAAIGGIDATNVSDVRRAGVAMAAVISAIASAVRPGAAVRELVALW